MNLAIHRFDQLHHSRYDHHQVSVTCKLNPVSDENNVIINSCTLMEFLLRGIGSEWHTLVYKRQVRIETRQ